MLTLENLAPSSPLLPHYDAVIVLGGILKPDVGKKDGIEFNAAVERVLKAIELLRSNRANYLILSGGDASLAQNKPSEAVLLKKFVVKWGIAPERVLVEPDSRNTSENALNTALIIRQYQWERVLLITSAFHLFRSNGAFRAAGIKADLLAVDYNGRSDWSDLRNLVPSSEALAQTNRVMHEFLGIIIYGLTGKAKYF